MGANDLTKNMRMEQIGLHDPSFYTWQPENKLF